MSVFRHYVPAAKRVEGFPFSFQVSEIQETQDIHHTIIFDMDNNENLIEALTIGLQPVFEFYKYLDPTKETYIKKTGISPRYNIKIEVYKTILDPQTRKNTKLHLNTLYVEAHTFDSEYKYTLIHSLEQLEQVLNHENEIFDMSFDVESSGLDPENDVVSGINLATSKDLKHGYYIPVAHNEQFKDQNLDNEKVFDMVYVAMLKARKVFMLNARFDIRNVEYQQYTLNPITYDITDIKYDMSKVNVVDTQISSYFADPDWKQRDMSFFEKHFLGFHRLDLGDTLSIYGLKDFDTTKIDPKNILFYAGQDAITTINLGYATEQYTNEFGLSGQIDMEIIKPLMRMENRLIKIDVDYVEQELAKLDKRLAELDTLIKDSIGYDINLNSTKQKVQLFKSFNLDTGVRTATGSMSTKKDAVDNMIDRLEASGKPYPKFLKYLGEQSKKQTLRSTFFYSLQQQMYYRKGRVRLNYRHGNTATGRFSSGKEDF